MKTYTNFKKIFLVRVFFLLKYIFRIKFKIPILDLMLLPKTVFHLNGYTPVLLHISMHNLMARKYLRELSYVSKSAVEHRSTAESQEEKHA